ncbi:MAG: hypothetical protein IPM29_10055 [Planctomycetes bacterium]|nr:hypothetical protein [Planctomycetota bacterium]
MTLELTGASPDNDGPAGCVARFLLAADARDGDACRAELHEVSRAQTDGAPEPPPMRSATVGAPNAVDDRFEVPVDFVAEDGTAPRFVFVVRRADTATGLGVDLDATMHATFGGDPAELLVDAMKQAVAPLGEAMENLCAGVGAALSGETSAATGAAARRTIGADESVPAAAAVRIPPVELEVVQLELTRSLTRAPDGDTALEATALRLRCRLDLPTDVVLDACVGLTLDAAEAVDGEDLRPDDASGDLGATHYGAWDQERRDWGLDLQLRGPRPSFGGLARLEGSVRLQLGAGAGYEVRAGRLGDLVDRSVWIEALGTELTFGRDDGGSFAVRAPYGALDGVELAFVDGAERGIDSGYSGFGDGETSTRCFDPDLPDEVSVLVRFTPPGEVVEVPFSTRGLPFRMD